MEKQAGHRGRHWIGKFHKMALTFTDSYGQLLLDVYWKEDLEGSWFLWNTQSCNGGQLLWEVHHSKSQVWAACGKFILKRNQFQFTSFKKELIPSTVQFTINSCRLWHFPPAFRILNYTLKVWNIREKKKKTSKLPHRVMPNKAIVLYLFVSAFMIFLT